MGKVTFFPSSVTRPYLQNFSNGMDITILLSLCPNKVELKSKNDIEVMRDRILWHTTIRYCCRGGIHCSSRPEPLMIKDKKGKVNKQKLNRKCPAGTTAHR